MSTLTTANAKIERINFSRLLWVGPLAAIVAAVANLIVLVIVQNLLRLPFLVPFDPNSTGLVPMPPAAVIIASAIPALVATILLAVLGKFLARPSRVFWIISVVLLILSFVPTLSLAVAVATMVTLNLMHVVAAVAIVGVLTTWGRER